MDFPSKGLTTIYTGKLINVGLQPGTLLVCGVCVCVSQRDGTLKKSRDLRGAVY